MSRSSTNSGHVVGNLVADPVLRETADQTPVCNLVVATHEAYKSGDQRKTRTDYHHCTAWATKATRIQQRLHKGDLVSIEGPMRTVRTEEDGVVRRETHIEVDLWELLAHPKGSRRGEEELET